VRALSRRHSVLVATRLRGVADNVGIYNALWKVEPVG
jgi:hypothetical protein